MAADSAFLVKNQKQIIQNLSLLKKQQCLFTAHFGEHKESFITAIVDIDQDKNQLLLDYGPKEYLNKLLLASPETVFKTELGGIKIAFSERKIKKTRHLNQIVFLLPIPKSMNWVERRTFYRIKTPASVGASCLILLDDERFHEFKLFDISLSGFSFAYETPELNKQFFPDAQFKQCKLLLPNVGKGNVEFVIRNRFPVNANKPHKAQRIGCEFTAIKTAFESSIQRFMQIIEIERRKKT